jgi:hypothetical protein
MNPVDPKAALLEVFNKCQTRLDGRIADNLAVVGNDPAPLKKKNSDILRMRVLPIERSPLNFWSATWCFYEVGLGMYGGKPTTGGVSFVQFPLQRACGDSRYLQPVISILQDVQKNATEFALTTAPPSTQLQRVYRLKEFPYFSVEQAAKDLAWLIEKTLPAFEAIS